MGNLCCCCTGMCLSMFSILFSQAGCLPCTETGLFSLAFPFHPLISPPGSMPVSVGLSDLFHWDFLGKLPSLDRFDVQKTVLFLNTHVAHSPTGTTHRSHATLLSLDQETLGATQPTHLRGTNCRSPLPVGDNNIGEERSTAERQLSLQGETLEDSGVVPWVDGEGFTGRLLDALECTGTGCATGWVDRTHGSCTVARLLVSKILPGWVLKARPREGDRRLSPKPTVSTGDQES